MTWLVDTNVLSELRKGDRAHPGVRAWFTGASEDHLYTSVLVLGGSVAASSPSAVGMCRWRSRSSSGSRA